MKKFTLISMPLCAVVLALFLVLTAGLALAGGPPPCDAITGPSDCVRVTTAAGGTVSFGFSDVPGGGQPEPPVLTGLIGLSGGNAAIAFIEPASEPNGGQISDILALINNQLSFVSDDDPSVLEGILAGIVGGFGITPTLLLETGSEQDVSALLGLTGTTVTVQSDVEAVPEPSTMLLLGSGVAGLVYWRRRLQA